MALIMESGTNLDTALDESAKVFNNKYLNSLIIEAKNDVIEGKDFVYSLNQANIFPEIFIQLISSGYRSGNLIKMFHKASSFLKNEIETKRSIFLSLLRTACYYFYGWIYNVNSSSYTNTDNANEHTFSRDKINEESMKKVLR